MQKFAAQRLLAGRIDVLIFINLNLLAWVKSSCNKSTRPDNMLIKIFMTRNSEMRVYYQFIE